MEFNMAVGTHLAWQIMFQHVSDRTFQHSFRGSTRPCRGWLGQRVEPCVIQNWGGPTVTPQKQLHYLFHSIPCLKLTSLTVSVQSISFCPWAISHMKICGAVFINLIKNRNSRQALWGPTMDPGNSLKFWRHFCLTSIDPLRLLHCLLYSLIMPFTCQCYKGGYISAHFWTDPLWIILWKTNTIRLL